jgi:hypothetical protein
MQVDLRDTYCMIQIQYFPFVQANNDSVNRLNCEDDRVTVSISMNG